MCCCTLYTQSEQDFAAGFLLPRSDKTWYAGDFSSIDIKDFDCFLLRDPMNFNCFFRYFNWVNTHPYLF